MTDSPPRLPSAAPAGPRRVIWRPMAVVVFAFVTLATAAPASAHSELVGSTPGDGARLVVAPRSISLEFNQDIDPTFASMVVSVDSGSPVRLDVTAGDSPSTVRATVPDTLSPTPDDTRWRVDYRVTSVDGHPIVGDIAFSVAPRATAGGDQSPPPETEPHSAPPDATADPEEGRGSTSVLVVAALMMLVLALPAALVLVRRRRDEDSVPRGEQQ